MGPSTAAARHAAGWSLALLLCVAGLSLLGCHRAAAEAEAQPAAKASATPAATEPAATGPVSSTASPTAELVRGKVVWLDEAVQRLYGIATEPAVAQTQVVLETADGQLLPILPDTRGRAFAVDACLRDIELELLVRRSAKVPLLQVIRVFRTTDQGRVEIDYWCDICAISMFILKDCECCQGATRLREQPVDPNEGRPQK